MPTSKTHGRLYYFIFVAKQRVAANCDHLVEFLRCNFRSKQQLEKNYKIADKNLDRYSRYLLRIYLFLRVYLLRILISSYTLRHTRSSSSMREDWRIWGRARPRSRREKLRYVSFYSLWLSKDGASRSFRRRAMGSARPSLSTESGSLASFTF
jgi:hypothetical protein